MVGVAFGLGFVVGPAIGGLLGSLDPRLPLWASAAACLINAGFGWFVLPESLPPEKRMAFAWKRANPVGSFRLLATHRELLGLAAVNFLGQVAHQVLPAVFVLYAAYRYGWGETNVGLTLAFVGVCSAVVQGALVGPVVARLGERRRCCWVCCAARSAWRSMACRRPACCSSPACRRWRCGDSLARQSWA